MEIAGSNFTSSKSFFTVHYSFGLTRKNDHSFCNVNYYELKEIFLFNSKGEFIRCFRMTENFLFQGKKKNGQSKEFQNGRFS